MSELQKYTYSIDIEYRSLHTSDGESAFDGQRFYDAVEVDSRLAEKDVAIEKLRDNIGGLIGENNDYMERCAEKDARLALEAKYKHILEVLVAAGKCTQADVDGAEKIVDGLSWPPAIICPGSGNGE